VVQDWISLVFSPWNERQVERGKSPTPTVSQVDASEATLAADVLESAAQSAEVRHIKLMRKNQIEAKPGSSFLSMAVNATPS